MPETVSFRNGTVSFVEKMCIFHTSKVGLVFETVVLFRETDIIFFRISKKTHPFSVTHCLLLRALKYLERFRIAYVHALVNSSR